MKRNGKIVDFNETKIRQAIQKAVKATDLWENINLDVLLVSITDTLNKNYGTDSIPTVEHIQEVVESVLITYWHDSVAKSYIRYRQKRNEVRADKKVMLDIEETMNEYLEKSDWRVNANANSWYSLGGLILNTSGKVTANYWLSHVYPESIGNLHRNADYHIHDLDIFGGYCAWRSLRQLLEEWLNGVTTRLESTPPKNLQSAVNQMVNFLWTLQNEWAWAQAFSSFDTYLAPYVHKYRTELEHMLLQHHRDFSTEQEKEDYLYTQTYEYVVQQMQNFIFGLNVPSRRWTQTPFTNITLDLVCPEDLSDKHLLLWGVEWGTYEKSFGELQYEMDIINKALVEVYLKGDAKWNVFTFPIPTYNITEDFERDNPIVDDIMEMTAKYGIPYFQNFVGSQWMIVTDENGKKKKVKNPKAYTPGAVRSMCCRLQLDLTELTKRWNGLFGSAEMTGSIGVVTINAARLWYLHAWDIDSYKERLNYLMLQAKNSLEIKRKELSKWLENGLFPYTKRYLHSYRNHFSTIWINGLNESILNFSQWKENITTDWWKQFAYDILEYMRAKLKVFQEETGNLYNLEATPAEWTTYRFAKEDQKRFPTIIHAGTQDAPYYTNSSQLPVEYTDDCFDALDMQNDLQCQYTGGTVLHLYLWERVSNVIACKQLIKNVLSNYQLPYITVTPTFSLCPKHWYLQGEHDYCPRCDEEIWYTGTTIAHDERTPFVKTL
jgi:anaerobic ribonucleoside-triphosphate reductase